MGMSTAQGFQAAGIGASMLGSYEQAQGQRNMYNYESQVASNNAVLADYQASVARQIGATEVNKSELATSQLMGTQRAGLAASGVDLGQGSASEVLQSTEKMGALDAMTIQDNANRQVWGDQVQAQNFRSQAAMAQSAAKSTSPLMAAGTSFLVGAGNFAANSNNLALLKKWGYA